MSVPRICADTWHALREKFYFLHDNFSSLRRQFSLSAQKVFVTNFVTCITNFVTRISKFVTCVRKFVIKIICADNEKLQGERKNFQGDRKKLLGATKTHNADKSDGWTKKQYWNCINYLEGSTERSDSNRGRSPRKTILDEFCLEGSTPAAESCGVVPSRHLAQFAKSTNVNKAYYLHGNSGAYFHTYEKT